MKTLHHFNFLKFLYTKPVLFLLLVSLAAHAQAQSDRSVKINLGLTYPLSSNGVHAPLDTNNLSINLLVGVSSEEKGPAFAGLSNMVKNNVHGSQFAGFSNHIGKKANGALFAGFINTYAENEGAAFAGFSNIAHGEVKGAQFAGFLNIATKVKGAQFAGFMNVANNVKANQLAGFMNRAKDVNGSQFSGFINVARKVKGVQFAGFINVAESSDCPIAILNFIKNGEKSIGVSIDENQTTMLSFRSGGKILYGILAAGYNFKNHDEVYAFEAGFGAHFLQSRLFRLNTELTASALESFKDGEYFKASFKLLPAVKIAKQLELFAGPSLNFITTNSIEGKALNEKYLSKWQGNYSNYEQILTIGYNTGLHFIF